ncbi:MAG: (4Fe-4S)-binding protein [Cyanobium sp. CACIAM 14]|nr:MAG: (4Fe-4S)-binding protein [Cyanobium sp. CACIAM 14]
MIVLKITNASDVVASNIGRFLERLTSSEYDQNKVEDIVIDRLAANLKAEGIRGEVAAVNGLDLHDDDLVLHDRLKIRRRRTI